MIEKLKKVELQDKNILEQYLIKCNRILCDFNFVNIFSWRNVFNTQWLFFDNTPVIYNAADDLILMPCSCCVSFDLILRLSDNFKNDGKSGNFALVDIDFVEKNKTEIEKYFKIELDENNADYIYITKKLVELRGKKLQKKKNIEGLRQAKKSYQPEFLAYTYKLLRI